MKVGAVNADDHKSLGSRFSIQGFPTIKIFGLDKNKPDSYNGARTAAGLVDSAINAAGQKARAALGGKRSSSGSDSKVITIEFPLKPEINTCLEYFITFTFFFFYSSI